MSEYFGNHTPKLGFGLMRLPREADGETIDLSQTKEMVDLFLASGFTYFDTAYVYGHSEETTKKALVERYPRDSYTLATKLNAHMKEPDEAQAKRQFEESLERTGAGYFDYYLLHALMDKNYTVYDEFGLWDFVKEKKAQGLIKHIGFSFHSGPELLEELLIKHPETEFVQLQINYADWFDPDVAAAKNYEIARKYGKSVVIMEPVKGGRLADPPAPVKKLFLAAQPELSFASWAIRFAASLDGVITVLSGMSNLAQMRDNLSYMRQFVPLNSGEQAVIAEAQKIYGQLKTISCTACSYCTDGCPMEIRIPDIFTAMNLFSDREKKQEAPAAYESAVARGGKASDCIECGQCETACPQQLKITELLKLGAQMFEE